MREVRSYIGTADFPHRVWTAVPSRLTDSTRWAGQLEDVRRTAAFGLIDMRAPAWGNRHFIDRRSGLPVVRYRDGTWLTVAPVPRPK
ncbi:hypothetical protein OG978_39005 [Streptomyces sp. NBC_01591]|uniref:hypothetical protein n=1 Tax=Streptomyces sp. NBC_01591 TaxID=2975888 RepID=UPI002DDB6AA3|nr:hypothetical protein [Streptomyces sp. NBC_01591]WSD72845.1 hypothetical protein OG978_39005 [Streptomyces sp. NBC_01591]